MKPLRLILLLGVAAGQLVADISLPAILGDNMVLQSGEHTRIWGQAISGERVTVQFQGQTYETVAVDNRWEVWLQGVAVGGPYHMELRGFNRLRVENILVGDVWLASGQSNMMFNLNRADNAEEAIAGADQPLLRLFVVSKDAADTPQDDVTGAWVECTPETVARFSAVQYFFGREIAATQGIPVGLVLSGVGGTRICSWIAPADLDANPDSPLYRDYFADLLADYYPAYATWLEAFDADPKVAGKPPRHPFERMPSGYYHAMIAPLQPLTLKGFLWYQGETDSWWAEPYERLFTDLIWSWRREWGQGELPFLFVQLASYNGKLRVDENYPYLRDAQRLVAEKVPGTAMAVAIDVGEEMDIHPRAKEPVGHRLALAARHLVYGEDVAYSGPWFESVRFGGGDAVVRFAHTEGGLRARSPELRGFEVAGQDLVFHPAQARIEGATVVLRADAVNDPRYVRYAWDGFPDCDLENGVGLPAVPFRTDDVKRLTKEEWEAKYPEKLAASEALEATLDVGGR